MAATLGIEIGKLPEIRDPFDTLGGVTDAAAAETGLRAGTPVLVGGADYPVSLLGSGVCETGLASDVTGTSCILTLISDRPLLDPEICNVLTIEGHWGPFVLLESGGDAMRWARRAFHDNTLDYAAIVERAAEAPAGADALFFLPYLAGERLGRHRNARAQFFGLGAAHGSAHLHRAVMEGVAFAAARHLRIMEAVAGQRIRRLIASGGGAKTVLWLKIKASIYGVPVAVPEEAECGIVGCAVIAQTATGRRRSLRDAVDALVRLEDEVAPDPAWAETYDRMMPLFSELYSNAQVFYDRLDAIGAAPEPVAARAVP
jgi:xylulokinase